MRLCRVYAQWRLWTREPQCVRVAYAGGDFRHGGPSASCQSPVACERKMRIWDVDPALLCRQHLLGEHRELHAVWTILTTDSAGYRRHPETLRWEGRLGALARRHDRLV